MRFAVAVVVGGIAYWAMFTRVPLIHQVFGGIETPYEQIIAITIAAVIGAVVPRLPWLAAAAAYVFAHALRLAIDLRPSPPWAPSDVWFLESWLSYFAMVGIGAVVLGLFAAVARFIADRVRPLVAQPRR